jgi:hypothetical protein
VLGINLSHKSVAGIPERCSGGHMVGRRGNKPLVIVCTHCRERMEGDRLTYSLMYFQCFNCSADIHGGVSNDYGVVVH